MSGLLVKVRGSGRRLRSAMAAAGGGSVDAILNVPGDGGSMSIAAGGATWLRLGGPGETPDDPAEQAREGWALAHARLTGEGGQALAGVEDILAIEPDLRQRWPTERDAQTPQQPGRFGAAAEDLCTFDDQDARYPRGPKLAWHMGPEFSNLGDARASVGADRQKAVRVAHLDTGYDPDHVTRPVNLNRQLQRNFLDDGSPKDATDRAPADGILANRGHGTATLALLAGAAAQGAEWAAYPHPIGGAPDVEIIPIRIADFVARLTVGTMVQGIDHARRSGAQVLSMSMGGVSSFALCDAVNLAYEEGLTMVTAAGNNFAGVPFPPKSIVFPARWTRVLAACGVMADGSAYAGLDGGLMQGNYGPPAKMATALGAYTPNTPWAQIDCAGTVHMSGGGTSAATPQIAAAAALWLAHHAERVAKYPKPWMRIEAVRHALFAAADKTTAMMGPQETERTIGQGVLDAAGALARMPIAGNKLKKMAQSEALWGWLQLVFGTGVSLAADSDALRDMLCLELTQMAQRVPEVDAAILGPERPEERISPLERNRYLEAALDAGQPSPALKAALEAVLGRPSLPGSQPGGGQPAPERPTVRRKIAEPAPPPRRLRIFALDPSMAKSYATGSIVEATVAVPWDDVIDIDNPPPGQTPLQPGPVGEYLEVIDVDPATGRVYEPVDLNEPMVLAQNGLAPSEGNPKFHQQMVYAVAMKTIRHFEEALGRPAQWSPRWSADDRKQYEVRRLRLYPHALRAANAYYSPDKKAVLFGYFPASAGEKTTTPAGKMVFTCLSSDIIAHEVSHALLDGLHRRFQEVSNPDVLAFHEAFADIVAIFQHFTLPELLEFEIARSRADLSAAGLLGGLAQQFGEASQLGEALRNYTGERVRNLRYEETMESHERGSIMVLAVYDAFLAIAARRIDELIRIATNGSGELPAGHLHPDLVRRLAEETRHAAETTLRMAIRALDYCPSIDITFGEYLRALITADREINPEEGRAERIAFIESFRNRGIVPNGVRTVSAESLTWNAPENDRPAWLERMLDGLDFAFDRTLQRSEIFERNEANRYKVWKALNEEMLRDPTLCDQLGLEMNLPRFSHRGTKKYDAVGATTFDVFGVTPALRVRDDRTIRRELIVIVLQRKPLPLDGEDVRNGFVWFRGGATMVIDPDRCEPKIRYIIVKNMDSRGRQRRQLNGDNLRFMPPGLRSLYFAAPRGGAPREPFALVHDMTRGLHGE